VKRSYTIDVSKLGEFEKKLPGMYKRAFLDAANKLKPEAIAELEKATTNAPPASPTGHVGAVATGKLRSSWKMRSVASRMLVEFYNDAKSGKTEYARHVEYGRSAGAKMPPRGAILSWMRAKGVGNNLTPTERRTLAWRISRNIARRGLRPRLILQGKNQSRTGNLVKKFYRFMRESIAQQL